MRQRIAGLYENASAEEILVHAGAEEAIFNFMNVVLQPGDHIIVQYPLYQSLFEVAVSIGCEVTKWCSDPQANWALDLDDLESLLKPNSRAVVINSPHNPTGFLMSRCDLQKLVTLSQRHGFIIFSDEVYRGLEYDRVDRLPAICDLDDRAVSLGVMSKSYGLAGLRIGWLATKDKDLYERLTVFKDYTTICNSGPSELLATAALAHGERLIARNLEIIHSNLLVLEDFFQEHSDLFSWRKPKAGPIAFPELIGIEAEQFCDNVVEDIGVMLLPGSKYDPAYNNIRIGFGRRDMPEALARLDRYIRERR